jgi:hypothetical protein
MNASCPSSARIHACKGLTAYGARRTTAHVLKKGLERTFGRVVGEVRRCGDVRRDHPVFGKRGVSSSKPTDIEKGEVLLSDDLHYNRHAYAAAHHAYGSFPGGEGARWRRHPISGQQNSPKSRLTRLTSRSRQLTRQCRFALHISRRGS